VTTPGRDVEGIRPARCGGGDAGQSLGMEATLGSAAAAPVMATASVSSALELDGAHVAADVLLLVAGAIAVVLAIALAVALRRDRRRLARAAATPASLTTVAAAGVIGMRLTQHSWDTLASWRSEAPAGPGGCSPGARPAPSAP